MRNPVPLTCFLPILLALLAGCEQLGIEGPAQEAAARDAEGRAIGGACRHSGRALEDCYSLNPRAVKAAVFTGWRDMDAYMRENNIEIVEAIIPNPKLDLAKKKKPETEEPPPAKAEETPDKKTAPPDKKPGAVHSSAGKALPSTQSSGKMV